MFKGYFCLVTVYNMGYPDIFLNVFKYESSYKEEKLESGAMTVFHCLHASVRKSNVGWTAIHFNFVVILMSVYVCLANLLHINF